MLRVEIYEERENYRSVGIEVTAHVFDFEFELALAALLGALESEMLEEVSGTVGPVRLCARAGVYPDSDGRCLGVWRMLRGNLSRQHAISNSAQRPSRAKSIHTVKPLLRVVLSVFAP